MMDAELFDQFFSLQDHLDGHNSCNNKNKPINKHGFCLFGSSDSGSELSSPIGSAPSSSSTESSEEEDDYIGELTRWMAQYMLQDEDKHEKTRGLSGSPESTIWSHLGSNLDSSAGPSREPSPLLTVPMIGDFAKMKINEETARFTRTSTSIQASRRKPNVGFQSKQAQIDEQIRAIQFSRLKQEQAMKQMEQKPRIKPYQTKGRVYDNSWYNLLQQQQQQQRQSNMRAVFLNSTGSRNGSCGTGVFLPRGIGTPCQSRKTQGSKKSHSF
ncbi:hypothetical protein PTKIN_Ptkin11bG0035500 [Pterospermum kingtungense]